MQDVADGIHILGQFGAALAVRGQELVHGFDHVLLQRACTGVADFLGDVLRIAAGHQTGGGQ